MDAGGVGDHSWTTAGCDLQSTLVMFVDVDEACQHSVGVFPFH